jgi:hypothetical protein
MPYASATVGTRVRRRGLRNAVERSNVWRSVIVGIGQLPVDEYCSVGQLNSSRRLIAAFMHRRGMRRDVLCFTCRVLGDMRSV